MKAGRDSPDAHRFSRIGREGKGGLRERKQLAKGCRRSTAPAPLPA
jgi:hypothetical protein